MKKLLCLVLLCLSMSAFACLEGRVELQGGAIILTAGKVTLDSAMAEYEVTTRNFLDKGRSIIMNSTRVKALYVEDDDGGVIYTIFEVEENGMTRIIKVKSNYIGNGQRTRGMRLGNTFKIDEEFGC